MQRTLCLLPFVMSDGFAQDVIAVGRKLSLQDRFAVREALTERRLEVVSQQDEEG
jgi:hypothetical protein